MPKILEIYLQPERYNPRIRATVSAAWMARYESGIEIAICREHEAANAEQVRAIIADRGMGAA